MNIIISVVAVVLMAALHRLRGGGIVTLPIKGTYVLWPIVGLIAFMLGYSPLASCIWAIGYLIWIVPGWMSVITRALGASVPADQVMGSGWDVRIVDALSFGNPVFGCFVRAGLFVLPLIGGLTLMHICSAGLLLVVLGFYPAYRIGYALRPTDMSSIAEGIVGAELGCALVIGRLL